MGNLFPVLLGNEILVKPAVKPAVKPRFSNSFRWGGHTRGRCNKSRGQGPSCGLAIFAVRV